MGPGGWEWHINSTRISEWEIWFQTFKLYIVFWGYVNGIYTVLISYQHESSEIWLPVLHVHEVREGKWNTLTKWWYQNESSDTRPSVLYIWSGGQWSGISTMLLSEWELRCKTISTGQGVWWTRNTIYTVLVSKLFNYECNGGHFKYEGINWKYMHS